MTRDCYISLSNSFCKFRSNFLLEMYSQQHYILNILRDNFDLNDNLIFVDTCKFCCWLVWDPPLFFKYVSESHFSYWACNYNNQSRKQFTNISFYDHTIRRVEPNYLPLSISLFQMAWWVFYIFIETPFF